MSNFEKSWDLRERVSNTASGPRRVFHGPIEGENELEKALAIDVFGSWAWVTMWDEVAGDLLGDVIAFLRSKNLEGAVLLDRTKPASDSLPELIYGSVPEEKFSVQEGQWKVWIDLKEHRHPGLFLDLFPLREKLFRSQSGKEVLNLFCFTGSISVASRAGGASKVTSIDLSKATIDWARENWLLNGFPIEESDFIYGDVFEWLQRFAKKGREFDTVISDPPSFSRGKLGVFSTTKDLVPLHEALMKVVRVGGSLITVINSEKVLLRDFESSINAAARSTNTEWKWNESISVPESFCGRKVTPEKSYLKGRILNRIR